MKDGAAPRADVGIKSRRNGRREHHKRMEGSWAKRTKGTWEDGGSKEREGDWKIRKVRTATLIRKDHSPRQRRRLNGREDARVSGQSYCPETTKKETIRERISRKQPRGLNRQQRLAGLTARAGPKRENSRSKSTSTEPKGTRAAHRAVK